MNLTSIIPEELINAIGWTILHSLWQGVLVAVILTTILLFMNKRSAKIRAMISYAALIIILASSFKTFTNVYGSSSEINTYKVQLDEEIFAGKYDLHKFENVKSSSNEFMGIFDESINTIKYFYGENLNVIVTLWLIGILFLTFKLTGGLIYTQRVKHYRINPVSEFWNDILKKTINKIDLNKKVKLFESALVKFPLVIGYFKPVILFPIGTLTGLPLNQVEAILAHELAHIKRADYILNILQSFIEIILFFNPAVWWISSIIRDEREYSCDDLAVEVCGSSVTLAKALINVKQNAAGIPSLGLAAIGNKKSLLTRIKRMSNYNNDRIIYPKKLATILFLLISFAAITFIACSTQGEALNANEIKNTSKSASILNASEMTDEERAQYALAEPIPPLAPLPPLPPVDYKDENEPKKYSFYDDEDGKQVHWEVVIENGEIMELYRDDEKIPDDEIAEYENYIFEKLDEIRDGLNELKFNMQDLHLNMEELHENLENLNFDFNFDFDFDDKGWGSLHEELDKLKDMELHFDFEDHDWDDDSSNHFKYWDKDEFREQLKESLSGLKSFSYQWNKDQFEESMRELKKNMKNFHLDMDDFKMDMKNFKEDMKEFKKEMKIFKGFMKEVRSELVKDGYIEDEDEEFDFDLDKNKMDVNDKKMPYDLHQKYLDMYEKHYGKKLEDRVRIKL
jgi:bla regulator protein BlaR1